MLSGFILVVSACARLTRVNPSVVHGAWWIRGCPFAIEVTPMTRLKLPVSTLGRMV